MNLVEINIKEALDRIEDKLDGLRGVWSKDKEQIRKTPEVLAQRVENLESRFDQVDFYFKAILCFFFTTTVMVIVFWIWVA